MQPTAGDLHINTPLTNVSVAFMQSATNFVASRVFPNVTVAKQSDLYYTFDRGDVNRDEMAERADGTESAGGGYNVSNDNYFAKVYAFHKDITDRQRGNADSQFNLDRNATNYVSMKALIKREKLFAARYLTTGVWTYNRAGVASNPVPGTSVLQWSDANSDPIKDIKDARRQMLQNTGFKPNKLTLSTDVYDVLTEHPDIIDRLKYGTMTGAAVKATMADLARLFEIDEVIVSEAIENTAKEGQAAVHQFIVTKAALLSYAPPAADLETPSAGYIFSWTGWMGAASNGQRIKMFRMEPIESDRVEIQMAFDMKVVSADLGYFFSNIIA